MRGSCWFRDLLQGGFCSGLIICPDKLCSRACDKWMLACAVDGEPWRAVHKEVWIACCVFTGALLLLIRTLITKINSGHKDEQLRTFIFQMSLQDSLVV